MTKKTASFLRRLYKGGLLAVLAILAFVLKFQDQTPHPTAFQQVSADLTTQDPDGGPDCPSPAGDCGAP